MHPSYLSLSHMLTITFASYICKKQWFVTKWIVLPTSAEFKDGQLVTWNEKYNISLQMENKYELSKSIQWLFSS